MDWPHVEETRWTCSQEGTGVEPTGEAKERKTPAHLETYENGGTGEEKSHKDKAKGTAKNRVRWRALVDALCSTRNEED